MPRYIKHTAPNRPFIANQSRAIEIFDAKPYQDLIVLEEKAANNVRKFDQSKVLQITERHLLFLQSAFVTTTYSTIKRRHRFIVCQEIYQHIISGGDFKSLSDRTLSAIQEIEAEGEQNDSRD